MQQHPVSAYLTLTTRSHNLAVLPCKPAPKLPARHMQHGAGRGAHRSNLLLSRGVSLALIAPPCAVQIRAMPGPRKKKKKKKKTCRSRLHVSSAPFLPFSSREIRHGRAVVRSGAPGRLRSHSLHDPNPLAAFVRRAVFPTRFDPGDAHAGTSEVCGGCAFSTRVFHAKTVWACRGRVEFLGGAPAPVRGALLLRGATDGLALEARRDVDTVAGSKATREQMW
jgi:hypothetical protein